MKSRFARTAFAWAAAGLLLAGCASPPVFIRSIHPDWRSVSVRMDRSYDQSWEAAVDYLIKRFDMEVLSRGDGFMCTHWSYTWKGEIDPAYRVRVALKFSPGRETLEIKTEAESLDDGEWVHGYDKRLREQVFTDLTALVGTPAATGGTP